MHQHVSAPIRDQVAISGHLQIAGVLAEKRHRHDRAALEAPFLAVSQLDDSTKSQLAQQGQVVIVQLLAIAPARHDDRRVFRQVEQCTRIDVVVMVMGQEDRGRFGKQRTPERGHRGFGEPREQPRVEEQHLVALAIEQSRMAQMQHIPVSHDIEPVGADGFLRSNGQTVVLMQRLHQMRQQALRFARRRLHDRLQFFGAMGAVEHAQQLADHRAQRPLIEADRNGLPLDGMEDPQSPVGHCGGFGRISRKLPLKRPVRLTAATDVLSKIGPGVHQLRIGIFQPTTPP